MSETTIREDLAKILDELNKAQEEGLQIDVASNAFIDRIEAIRRKTADDQWTLMAAALGEIAGCMKEVVTDMQGVWENYDLRDVVKELADIRRILYLSQRERIESMKSHDIITEAKSHNIIAEKVCRRADEDAEEE